MNQEIQSKMQELLDMCESKGYSVCVGVMNDSTKESSGGGGGSLEGVLSAICSVLARTIDDGKITRKEAIRVLNHALKTRRWVDND